jgi:hypothetical protein
MRAAVHGLCLSVLASGLCACGDDKKPTSTATPPVTVHDGTMDIAADYSCLGHRVDPAGAATEFTVDGRVTDFQSKGAVPDARVDAYEDLEHLLAGTAYDSKTADNLGRFTGLRLPPNHYRITFKITAAPDQIDTYEFNIPVPAGTTSMERNSVSYTTARALPGLVGIAYDQNRAVIAGGVRDCGASGEGRFVKGGLLTSAVAGQSTPDTQVFYFSDQDLPVRRAVQAFTNTDGLFTVINADIGMATVEARGILTDGQPAVTLGREQVPLVAGALSIVDVPPLAQ